MHRIISALKLSGFVTLHLQRKIIFKKISVDETFGLKYAPNEAKQTQYEKSPNKRKGVCFYNSRTLPTHQQGMLLLRMISAA